MTRVTRLPSLGPRGEGWVAIQFILLGAIIVAGPIGEPWATGWIRVAGVVAGLILMSLGLVLSARGLLDLRHALTPLPHPRDGAELVESGIYARVRHPIYGGLMVGSLGWAIAWASLPATLLVAGLALFFTLKSAREEAWLLGHYAGYAAYRDRTRRFIPWIG